MIASDHYGWSSLEVGENFQSRIHVVSESEIIEFAKKYDPLLQHMSQEKCIDRNVPFCASGIHVLALVQELMCEMLYRNFYFVLGSEISSYSMRQPLLPYDNFIVLAVVESKERHVRKKDSWWLTLNVVIDSCKNGRVGGYSIKVFVNDRC